MAEFCKDCFKYIALDDISHYNLILSDEPWLCEGCGEWKLVVERIEEKNKNEETN